MNACIGICIMNDFIFWLIRSFKRKREEQGQELTGKSSAV